MEVTRRGRAVAALAGLFALGAAGLDRPLLFGGTVGLGGWLLARQARYVADVAATVEGLTVGQEPAREVLAADETVRVTLTAALERPAPVAVTVEARPPVGTTGPTAAARTVTIPAGEREAATTFALACPVAGRHEFRPARVSLADPEGLFGSEHRAGPTPTLTVEPRTPAGIHLGEGGERVAGAFGEHPTGRLGPGIEPAEIRAYVPGDPADSIDWKATARLAAPHVREYEVETDLVTALVVDGRATMAAGREGRTKLDYARQVALAYLAATRDRGGAVGLYAVGDGGLAVREPPATGEGHYAALRLALHDLAPTTGDGAGARPRRPPGEARRAAAALAGDDSAFARRLRPFFADAEPYVARIEEDPLYGTVRSELRSLGGPVVTVLLTDDERPAEVREAVKLARRGDDSVVVFLLPTVLFEPGGLADLEAAYERYVGFEEFRRELARIERVSAFEVAPPDRIEALLAARRRGADA